MHKVNQLLTIQVEWSGLKYRDTLRFLSSNYYWRGKMEMMQRLGIEVSLFDFMENNATDEERNAGYDIADYLLKAETKESVLSRMIVQNPHLETLISTLDLEVVSIEKHP